MSIFFVGLLLLIGSLMGLVRFPRQIAHWCGLLAGVFGVFFGVLFWIGQLKLFQTVLFVLGVAAVPLCLLVLALLLLANGIQAIRRLDGISSHSFLAAAGVLAVGICGVCLLWLCPLGTVRAGLLYGIVILMVYLALQFLLYLLSLAYFSCLPRRKTTYVVIDGIGGCKEDGTLKKPLKKRLLRGCSAVRPGETEFILAGTGSGPHHASEVTEMRRFLLEQGVADDAISIEERGDTVLGLLCLLPDSYEPDTDVFTVLTECCDVWTVSMGMEQLQLQGEAVGTLPIRSGWIHSFVQAYVSFCKRTRVGLLLGLVAWLLLVVTSLMPVWKQ